MRPVKPSTLLVVVMGLTLTTLAVAQEPYILSVSGSTGTIGGTAQATVNLDNNGSDIQGWSLGVCNDPVPVTPTEAVDGSTTATVNNGGPPDFDQISVFPDGFTVGVVICFTACAVLPPGTGYELNVATYQLNAVGTAALSFCDTLGVPPVQTVVVVGGQSITPQQIGGSIEVIDVPPLVIELAAGDADVVIDAGGNTLQQGISTILLTNDDPDALVQGFSFGLAHDESKLTLVDVNIDGTVTETVNGNTGPEFMSLNPSPDGGGGGTVGVVISLTAPFDTIGPGVDQPLVNFVYEGGPTAADGDVVGLDFDAGLGAPPVAIVVVINENSFPPTTAPGVVTVTEQAIVLHSFLRGDANSDGIVNIADGIWVLNYLWQSGPVPPCLEAANADGDAMGMVDTSDAIFILHYRLLSGPPPPAPFPGCGLAQQDDDCASDTAGCP